MSSIVTLAENACQATSSAYINLIKDISELLVAEKGAIGNLGIEGRLVNVQASGEAIIIGDLHGDLKSLAYILQASKFLEKAEQNQDILLVFLGDYGDRGPFSPEVYYVVLKVKQRFPQKVVLMRGNHEGPNDLLAYPHDLPNNLRTRFGEEGKAVYSKIRALFQHLYTMTVVQEVCILLHGGVPSHATSIEDLRYAHLHHPREPHLEEILWSDPDETIEGTHPSVRGAGRLFGEDVTERFLNMLNVKMLIRGHEPIPDGFQISHNGKILTLFSRKGSPYFNASAAYLQFDLSQHPENAHQLEAFVHTF
jgi:protein phosphatase